MSDIRVADTETLLVLNSIAKGYNFNRQLSDECITRLDPDGWHILTLVLWGSNVDHCPVLHHRTEVLMKFTGDGEANKVFLDVSDTDWNILETAETAIERKQKDA